LGGKNAPDFGCDKTENKTLLKSCEFIYSFIHSHHGALILASMGRGGGTGGGVLGSWKEEGGEKYLEFGGGNLESYKGMVFLRHFWIWRRVRA
jgi:hypothetical protein